MRFKKTIGLICAMSMAFSMIGMASAATATLTSETAAVKALAYMDLDSAPVSMQEEILEAREKIIFGDQAWTVDGAVCIVNLEDGTVKELPEFSDLFPGWDVPTAEQVTVNYLATTASGIDDSTNVRFTVANSFVNSKEFYTFNGIGDYVGVYASTAPSDDARYNIGFSNASSGSNLGWVPNLALNEGACISTKSNVLYGIRGSVANSSDVGWYRMNITSDSDVIGDFSEVN